MTAAKQVYEWVKTGHWSLSEFKEWAEQAKPVAQYSDIISDGGLDPRNQFDAPPQRQPLTDDEIHDCFQQRHKDKVIERRLITRAIEAKLKEKNT